MSSIAHADHLAYLTRKLDLKERELAIREREVDLQERLFAFKVREMEHANEMQERAFVEMQTLRESIDAHLEEDTVPSIFQPEKRNVH